ncbi:uncharacterized protein topaz1 isoform X2 [Osmerus eperlanus]|uniref:uncharacterized protein topaz1 isoform X2 n=1 Tax=Osmerus eperlanus TaxID=29151 RepID=UPI002E101806
MIASSRKVKLNRNMFKDANGLSSVPKRRRPFTSYPSTDVTFGETLECKNDRVAKTESVLEDTEASNEEKQSPRQTLQVLAAEVSPAFIERTTPSSSPPSHKDEWQRSSHVSQCKGTLKSKRNDLKCNRENCTEKTFEVKVEGPYTRSKYYKCRRFTRSMGPPLRRTGFSCSLQFAVCFCGDFRNKQINTQKIERTQTRESKVSYIQSKQTFKAKTKNSRDVQRNAETRLRRSSSNTKNTTGISQSLLPGKVVKTYPLRSLKKRVDSVYGVSATKTEGGHEVGKVLSTVPTLGTDRIGTLIDSCCLPVNHAGRDGLFIERTKSSHPAISSKQASRGASGADMLDKDTEEDPEVGNDLVAAEKQCSKRIRLGYGGYVATVLLGQEQEGSNVSKLEMACGGSMKANGEVALKPVITSDIKSPVDSPIRDTDDSDNPVRRHDPARQDGIQRRDSGGRDISQDSSEEGLFSLSPDEARMACQANGEPSEQALFSCQRVIPYVRRPKFSCARTDMTWPFPVRKPPAVTSHLFDTSETPTMDTVQSSATAVSCASRTGHLQASTENVVPSHGMTNHIPNANQRMRGEGEVTERGEQLQLHWIEKCREKPEFSSSGRLRKAVSTFLPELNKPMDHLPLQKNNPVSPLEDFSCTVPKVFMLKGGSETDTTFSPDLASTPSPIGLSDTDTASVSFPMLFPSTPDSVYGFSPTASSNPASFTEDGARNVRATSSLAASSSCPSSKDMDKIAAVPDLNTSGDFSETSTASNELCSRSHNSFLQSLNDSFHSSQSSFLLAQEDGEIKEPKQGGTEEKRSDVFSHCILSIPPLKEQHDDHLLLSDPTAECEQGSSWPPDSRDGSQVATDDRTPDTPPGVSTPATLSITSLLLQTQSDLDEEVKEGDMLNHEEECGESQPSPTGDHTPRLVIDTRYYSDNERVEDKEGHGSSGDEMRPFAGAAVDTNPHLSPSGDEDDDGEMELAGQSSEEEEGGAQLLGSPGEGEETESEKSDGGPGPLDELAAYKQDILVVDVIQDDPDLFGNLPEKSLLNLGPTRKGGASGARATRVLITPPSREPSWASEKSLTSGAIAINGANTFKRPATFKDNETSGRSWRPQSSSKPSLIHSNSWPPGHIGAHPEGQKDGNNISIKEQASERIQNPTLNSLKKTLTLHGQASQIKIDSGDLRHTTLKSDKYCRFYFKDDTTCTYKSCWYRHLPMEGDEMFCVQNVLRFSNSMNLVCLQKAAAVFAGYYQSSAPGIYLTPPVVNSLLSVLLKAGLVSDIVHVLNVCAARKILPSPDFLLALFNHVREKAVLSLVPELMHLTTKMVDAGLAINMGDCKRILCNNEPPSPPMDTQIPASALHRPPTGKTTISDTKYLANAIQEVELCAQQEDWCRLGAVFRSVCLTLKGLSELQHFSGCVAIALLTETKDRLALPFATFSYTVCQENSGDGLVKSFLGRIGISLMFRYHKNQQWAKGQRLVEVLTRLKVNYSTLKGLFGNEDGASRCRLVSMATELFLRSGSVEGALNTLRDNKWFLGSSLWPCEPTDVIERTNVLVCLAKKTSHRDTLEVLTNLPGLKEPTDMGSMSQYESLFNSHLSVCVERQTLPVAADTLDFMLSKRLAVEPPLLHTLLHKLGKQNVWLRARGLFKCSLCGGYYPGVSAPPGSLALTVPCSLGEIEMALAFEMFITLNAAAIFSTPDTPACLSISLTRTLDCESGYLSAGSRLLSAAIIPNPKLTVRYRAVNSANEQVFLLDTPSARRWLQQNHSWASEVWTQTT